MSEFFSFFESSSVIRGILGFILVFLVPGFAWTLVFFKQIDVLERIALSFGLSIAVVTLSILVLNKLIGIRISELNLLANYLSYDCRAYSNLLSQSTEK